MFYGAYNTKTATEENRDDRRLITIGEFVNQRHLNLIDFTKIPKLPSIFDEEQRALRNAIRFLRSFVNDLSKPISKVELSLLNIFQPK